MNRLTPAVSILAIPLLLSLNSPVLASENPCAEDDNNAYNGHTWPADPSVCVPGVVTIKTWYTPQPPYAVGGAVWYDPYLMEGTARYRGLDLEGYLDGVALMSPADTGRTVWLKRPGFYWEGPYLVVDNSRRSDIWPIINRRNEIVEVGFQTAVRWGMVSAWRQDDGTYTRPYSVNQWIMREVEVLKMDELPPWIDEHEPLDFTDWWSERATFVNSYEINKPVQLKQDHPKFPGWLWRGTDPYVPMNVYDDWFDFLWPDDERFEFDLPDNYPPAEPLPNYCVLFYHDIFACPGH